MARFGRPTDHLKILHGLSTIVGRTAAEAEEKFQELQSMIHPVVGLELLSEDLEGIELGDLPLDEPIPRERIPATANRHKQFFDQILRLIDEEHLTLRQLYLRYGAARGGEVVRGTPSQIADHMEAWFLGDAADGFMLTFPLVPAGLDDFIELVVPELAAARPVPRGLHGPHAARASRTAAPGQPPRIARHRPRGGVTNPGNPAARMSFRFDPFDFAVHADPYPFYRELRQHYPAYYSEDARCWVLSRHADVVAAMMQPAVFSSSAGNVINDSPEKVGRTVGSADPPRHTWLRALVNEAFTRRSLAGEPERIRAEAIRLIEAQRDAAAFDLVRDVTAPLAGAVMATLLGMQGTDLGQFKRLLDISLYRDPVTRERTAEGVQAQADLLALVAEGVAHKRAQPGRDLISNLIAARIDGEALAPDEVVWMSRAILGAGLSPPPASWRTAHSHCCVTLRNARCWLGILTLLDPAIEEMLRYETPAQRFARVLASDYELHGQTMRQGTKVMVLYGSANRDETVFAEPDRFDITRRPTRHLGFGHGIHFCAGAALARMVARIYFVELLQRLPASAAA